MRLRRKLSRPNDFAQSFVSPARNLSEITEPSLPGQCVRH
jgi:hypothetical protein